MNTWGGGQYNNSFNADGTFRVGANLAQARREIVTAQMREAEAKEREVAGQLFTTALHLDGRKAQDMPKADYQRHVRNLFRSLHGGLPAR